MSCKTRLLKFCEFSRRENWHRSQTAQHPRDSVRNWLENIIFSVKFEDFFCLYGGDICNWWIDVNHSQRCWLVRSLMAYSYIRNTKSFTAGFLKAPWIHRSYPTAVLKSAKNWPIWVGSTRPAILVESLDPASRHKWQALYWISTQQKIDGRFSHLGAKWQNSRQDLPLGRFTWAHLTYRNSTWIFKDSRVTWHFGF